jgi:hypothetical protein
MGVKDRSYCVIRKPSSRRAKLTVVKTDWLRNLAGFVRVRRPRIPEMGRGTDTVPQPATHIMSFWVMLHPLGARVPIQAPAVLSQTEKDTLRRNGLYLDGPPQGADGSSVGNRTIALRQPGVFR